MVRSSAALAASAASALALMLLLGGCAGASPATPVAVSSSSAAAAPVASPAPAESLLTGDGCARIAEIVGLDPIIGSEGIGLAEYRAAADPANSDWWGAQPDLRPELTVGGIFCQWLADAQPDRQNGIGRTLSVQVVPADAVAAGGASERSECAYVPGGEGNVACAVSGAVGAVRISLRSDLHTDAVPDAVPSELRSAWDRIAQALEGDTASAADETSRRWTLPGCAQVADAVGGVERPRQVDPTEDRGPNLTAAGVYADCGVRLPDGEAMRIEVAPGASPRWSEIVAPVLDPIAVPGAQEARTLSRGDGTALVAARAEGGVVVVVGRVTEDAVDAAQRVLTVLR